MKLSQMLAKTNKSIIQLFLILGIQLVQGQSLNITDFGAISDGKTLCTEAIQEAIDQAHEDGGGRVLIPEGRFLSGSIVLKTGVTLHLEQGAVLLGSTSPEDYLTLNRWKALIMADQASEIGISGQGTIDGQGAKLAMNIDSLFYIGELDSGSYQLAERRPIAPLRPQIIEMVRCQQIHISGIHVINGASWVQSYDLCEDLIIEDLRVESDTYWNNDGIDIIDCKRVVIRNCFVNSSDDGICLKSYAHAKDGTEFCEDILIENCTVRSSASAVKFGTASYGGFRRVVIRDIRIYDTFRSAIAIENINAGFLEDILVENIHAVNTGNAIFIRRGLKHPRKESGVLRNIVIRNMFVQIPSDIPDKDYSIRGPALPFFHNPFPASIAGIPGFPVENVRLENIEIRYPGGGNPAYAHVPLWRIHLIPEQIDHYPEYSMFGELPAWGLYLRHVRGLTLHNVRLIVEQEDYRPAIVGEDVEDLHTSNLEVIGDTHRDQMYFIDSSNLTGENE